MEKLKTKKTVKTPKGGNIYGWRHWVHDAFYAIWATLKFCANIVLSIVGIITALWLLHLFVKLVFSILDKMG